VPAIELEASAFPAPAPAASRHLGPFYDLTTLCTNRLNYYGAPVGGWGRGGVGVLFGLIRAALIDPITPEGCVY